MNDRGSQIVLIGIFIILFMIVSKPDPRIDFSEFKPVEVVQGDSFVHLGENRIAFVYKNGATNYRNGEIMVLEFNEEKKTFDVVGRYNYLEAFDKLDEWKNKK